MGQEGLGVPEPRDIVRPIAKLYRLAAVGMRHPRWRGLSPLQRFGLLQPFLQRCVVSRPHMNMISCSLMDRASQTFDSEARRRIAAAITAAEAGEPIPISIDRSDQRAHVIGITGAPGIGKSCLTSALVAHYRSTGRTVAVLAI